MIANREFERELKRPEFWALVKLVSQLLKYSTRKTKRTPSAIKVYTEHDIATALRARNLNVNALERDIRRVAEYSRVRAEMLHKIEPQLMNREEAAEEFTRLCAEVQPPATYGDWANSPLVSHNKQKAEKKHAAFLASMVNLIVYRELRTDQFDHSPRSPLTFTRDGKPLRTLFRWMDGAYPNINQPIAAWEVKEYYGTKTFGSRVADGVYETALDGYELNELRAEGIDVKHYLFVDDRFTWWDLGKSYLCRIVDMLHSGLLDGAFFGREVLSEWPQVVRSWTDTQLPAE